ncbi:hypothetical protein [uncultured Fibrobacter sp.]|uniref:hypothetical protein n=1 Tax=uncultured Fibrobacter sp. TaxID=261512 RepID=UPI0025FA318C|nr:hypothetical protein [uncultured Fibrobacter sp.]
MKNLVQTLLLSSVAALFASCNNSMFGSEPSSSALDGKCTIDMSKYKTQEQLDSLRTFCDTIFVRSVVNIYRDTVYDDTLITDNEKYTSFIYFDRYTEKYDTLTKHSAAKSGTSGPCGRVPVYCNLDSSDTQKTFSCEISSVCYMYNQTDNLATSSAEVAVVRLITNEPLCSEPGYRCVRDTVFHDVLHKTYRTIARDTTFLNYGPRAWTDYVPAINAPAFDTATFRKALDTLDTQKPIFGIDTLFSGYTITVDGLPDWASNTTKCTTTEDSSRICIYQDILRPISMLKTYPTFYNKKPFYLWNNLESPLEKDTLITWKLRYRYSGGHNFEGNRDSLEITTLFKGI